MASIARNTRLSGPSNVLSFDDNPNSRVDVPGVMESLESVMQRDDLKNRAQLVIGVRTPSHYVQAQVYFCKRTKAHRIVSYLSREPCGELTAVGRFRIGFLRRVALQIFQLRVEIVYFVSFVVRRDGFLPFRERALPATDGAIGLPQFHVHVAQVAQDRGIVTLPVRGFAQIFFRLR